MRRTTPRVGTPGFDRLQVRRSHSDGSRVAAKPGSSDASLNSIDWSPSGDRFVVDDDAGGVEVISAAGNVLATLSKHGAFPRWSPDGKRILFLENGLKRDAIVISDPTGKNRRVVISIPVLAAAESAAWSPDGKRIAYIGQTGLHVVDVQTGSDRLLKPTSQALRAQPATRLRRPRLEASMMTTRR